MRVPVLTDDDVGPLLDMRALVAVIEDFLRAQHSGTAVTPSRHRVGFEPYGNLVFTIGGVSGDGLPPVAGFRVYETFAGSAQSVQIVAVWNSATGELLAIILGDALGAWRTGALGGVAVKYLSRPDAATCAVIGTGVQARTQLLGAAACRTLCDVRVYGRNPQRRRDFAAELAADLGIDVRAASSAREAVDGADIVLCATTAPRPVIETSWPAPGAHVNTVGPKRSSAHELPSDIGERAALVVTDSVDQLGAYGEPSFLANTAAWPALQNLAEVVGGASPVPRNRDALSLYCSVGLAGTEVAVAAHVLARWRRQR